ncbi:MAG: ABC transporter ATP-binding protein [Planctomycetaceae bacterium]|nr:ABC transporter ATP-binding protein [Planctomycetaceae bacterium]
MPADSPLIEVRELSRRHPKEDKWLLHGICFSIAGGDRVVISGPSGSGKTLLLRAVAQLDPIDQGDVLWKGHSVQPAKIPAFRREVLYLHQDPVFLEGSVKHNLEVVGEIQLHRGHQLDEQRVENLFRQFGCQSDFLTQDQRDLSGGEKQIATLARALQLDPTVLLLDEPTTALDDHRTRVFEDQVQSWISASRSNRAAVWVTHDQEQSRRFASRTIHLESGRITDVGYDGISGE